LRLKKPKRLRLVFSSVGASDGVGDGVDVDEGGKDESLFVMVSFLLDSSSLLLCNMKLQCATKN